MEVLVFNIVIIHGPMLYRYLVSHLAFANKLMELPSVPMNTQNDETIWDALTLRIC